CAFLRGQGRATKGHRGVTMYGNSISRGYIPRPSSGGDVLRLPHPHLIPAGVGAYNGLGGVTSLFTLPLRQEAAFCNLASMPLLEGSASAKGNRSAARDSAATDFPPPTGSLVASLAAR